MSYKYFSQNGQVLPAGRAVVPLDNVEFSYGFGVYETVRVVKEQALFLDEHCRRLMSSARIIGLEHDFDQSFVERAVNQLVEANQADTCNLKILLIGAPSADRATLNILCLNPLFPDRKLYKDGAHCVTYRHERPFPGAKTLNMLPSYLAYREAKAANAYDALLINQKDCVTEGTRTNFFAIKGKTLTSPKADDILEGVTRAHVISTAEKSGFKVIEQDIKLADIADYDSAFLTGTPIKILPIRSVDKHAWPEIPPALRTLMAAFDQHLAANS